MKNIASGGESLRNAPNLGIRPDGGCGGVIRTVSGKDILVIDAGTCITYEFYRCRRTLHGGNISLACRCALGRSMSSQEGFPLVLREGRRLPLGSDTDTAMREGVLKGMEYEISGYITAMKHKYPELLVFNGRR